MARLLRSTAPVAAWTWTVNHDRPGESFWICVNIANSVSRVLRDLELQHTEYADIEWLEYGKGYIQIESRVRGAADLDSESLFNKVMASHPRGHPEVVPDTINLIGHGYWINPEGEKAREPDLIRISCLASDTSATIRAMVYHDIWSKNDFHGEPHPETYQNNHKRLSISLKSIEKLLGVRTDPDDPTYFGTAFNYGVGSPNEDVGGLDVTDEL